ncbi:TIGR03503 family protein [Thalassotalea fusca]
MGRVAKKIGVGMAVLLSAMLVTAQETEVKYYEDTNVTNQIPFFENRFRIDAELDEITLIFYRRSGSTPIILVRPDGSKLRINNLPDDGKVEWFDDRTFDMIRIRQPMPGPWQAVGEILPNSQIMVVSDVMLKVDPLPELVMSGETLKVVAQVLNGDKVIDDPLFNAVIHLDIDFFSTNNSNYDNFGSDNVQIGSFRDDGYELDEYARDGIFTAEFELNFAAGEWVPVYSVKMPMATRELRQQPVIIQPNPITLSVETTTDELSSHKLNIQINEELVLPDTLVFQGRITFPDKQTEPFSITTGTGAVRLKEIGYTEPGIHRVVLNAFGQTVDGREFRLVVPEYAFNVERVGGPLVPTLDENGEIVAEGEEASNIESLKNEIEANQQALEEALAAAREMQIAKAEEKKWQNITLIVVGNIIIVLIAAVAFFVLRRKRKN